MLPLTPMTAGVLEGINMNGIKRIGNGRYEVWIHNVGAPVRWEFRADNLKDAKAKVAEQKKRMEKRRSTKSGLDTLIINPSREIFPRRI